MSAALRIVSRSGAYTFFAARKSYACAATMMHSDGSRFSSDIARMYMSGSGCGLD